jgi:hypothetical protein
MGKKKDEHHGGAWKVAYADFVTAMMALFIVLWICKDKPKLAALISSQFKVPLTEWFFGGSQDKEGDQSIDEVRMTQDEIDKTIEKIAAELQKLMDKEDPDQNTMEVQITDFENAAFTVFVVLLSRVCLFFDMNLYIRECRAPCASATHTPPNRRPPRPSVRLSCLPAQP